MNSKLQWMFSRRSVRVYQERAVPEAMLHDLVEAGMAAPSACAKDPWHIIVIRERATLKALSDGMPNGKMLAQAGAGFVVCGSLAEAHGNLESFMLQDCSAAIENILLAAHTLGLGACWLGIHPREDRMAHARRVLDIPAEITPIGGIAIGWPAETPAARTRFNAAKVHAERW